MRCSRSGTGMLAPKSRAADPDRVLSQEERRQLAEAKKGWWVLYNAYEAKLAELARREDRPVAAIRAEAEM